VDGFLCFYLSLLFRVFQKEIHIQSYNTPIAVKILWEAIDVM
jgi:hypothetical protein